MSKAEERVLEAFPLKIDGDSHGSYDSNVVKRIVYQQGYEQAEKDVAESFARIIRGNLSMIDKSVQDKFEQLYTDITGERMYKGFKD